MRRVSLARLSLILAAAGFAWSPAFVGQRFQRVRSAQRVKCGALPKEELIRLTKEFLDNPDPDMIDKDFVFRAPVIGPLTKDALTKTLSSVGKSNKVAFPDMETNTFGFTADDPIEPNRVWYFVRPRGTFSGPFEHPIVGIIQPTGKKMIAPPEVRSLIWTDDKKVIYNSIGYCADRFTGDNTNGQGGVFALYQIVGQPIDASIGSMAVGFFQKLSMLLPDGTVPRSYSKEEDIPSWWKDPRRGCEP